MSNTFHEENNRITFSFDEKEREYDEVETLCNILGGNDIYPVGEAYTQMDGTCPSLWYSMYSGMVYIIDLNGDCKQLKEGKTVIIEGHNPSDEEWESIKEEDWYFED